STDSPGWGLALQTWQPLVLFTQLPAKAAGVPSSRHAAAIMMLRRMDMIVPPPPRTPTPLKAEHDRRHQDYPDSGRPRIRRITSPNPRIRPVPKARLPCYVLHMSQPIIGLTLDSEGPGGYSKQPWYALRQNYCEAVVRAGGLPMLLPHEPDHAEA